MIGTFEMQSRNLVQSISKLVFSALLMLALLLPPVPASAEHDVPPAGLQPLLKQIALVEPDRLVRVIVQKSIQGDSLETLTAKLGGTVITDLHIINAFMAEMPAKAILELSQAKGVRWISFDAPVVKQGVSANESFQFRDDFEQASYTANDGTMAWQGPWSEIGESDGSAIGDVSIVRFMAGTAMGVRIQNSQRGIMREADLSEASAAQLTIDFRHKGFKTEADYVTVEASADGGQSWNLIGQIGGVSTADDIDADDIESATYDLMPHASNQTTIRLMTSTHMNSEAKFYLDSVEITVLPISESENNLQPALYLPMVEAPISSAQFNANSVQHATLQSASVRAAGVSGQTWVARDEFNEYSYGNNNGSGSWSSDWIETNDNSSPKSGDVRIRRNMLVIRDDNKAIMRRIDLSGASEASLSFSYQRISFDKSSDYVVLEILAEGDTTWTELSRFTGRATDNSMRSVEYDISEHISKSTVIRFVTPDTLSSGDKLYIDNVQIHYDGLPISAEVDGGTTFRAQVDSDTYIDELKPSKNYGDDDELSIKFGSFGQRNHTLMKYAISDELMGCTAVSARAVFFDGDPDDNFVGVYRVTSGWTEDDVTWNSAPTYQPVAETTFQIEDDAIVPNIIDVTPILDLISNANISAHVVDVTSIAQTWLDGTPNHGIMLQSMDDSGSSDHIFGREADPSLRPYMEIDAICSAGVSIGVPDLDDKGLHGSGIGVAVVDSGIAQHDDFLGKNRTSRIVHRVKINKSGTDDSYGHGTHVAGIIGGTGVKARGAYKGIASAVDLIDVKVTDDFGSGSTSDVIAGLQWILENREEYNIRVANLSLNSTVAESYHSSPLNAALEILWFNGIVVVVSSGNSGSGAVYPPANDPFLITVGAVDGRGTPRRGDDTVASFSTYGTTVDGFLKPDIVAPGSNIIGPISGDDSNLVIKHPAHKVAGKQRTQYFRMSGTSMASGVVAGAVALLLQNEPNLTPDQVKYRLMSTARTDWSGYDVSHSGAGYLDIHAAIRSASTESANTGLEASQLLWTGSNPVTWNSVNWNSVNWNSVNWNSVNWNSVNWNSVNWNSVSWDD